MTDRLSPIQANYTMPEDFVALAKKYRPDAVKVMLGFVWQGYDKLRNDDGFRVQKGDAHREDDITLRLHDRVQDVADPFSPFLIVHQRNESAQQKSTGRPPQSDLAFRMLGGNVRSHFSIEAKVIKTEGAVSEYVKEITGNFLTGRYAAFSSEAAMLGYQLSGSPVKAFKAIGIGLECSLNKNASFPKRNHRISTHTRSSEGTPQTPAPFRCHHMLMEFG